MLRLTESKQNGDLITYRLVGYECLTLNVQWELQTLLSKTLNKEEFACLDKTKLLPCEEWKSFYAAGSGLHLHFEYVSDEAVLTVEKAAQIRAVLKKINNALYAEICPERFLPAALPVEALGVRLYKAEDSKNLTLQLRDGELRVHSVVLCAHSAYFQRRETTPMQQGVDLNRLDWSAYEPALIHNAVFYMYNGAVKREDFIRDLAVWLDFVHIYMLPDLALHYLRLWLYGREVEEHEAVFEQLKSLLLSRADLFRNVRSAILRALVKVGWHRFLSKTELSSLPAADLVELLRLST